MASVAEGQAVLAHADKLILSGAFDQTLGLGVLPQVIEAQRVELVCIREDIRVVIHGNGRDFDRHPCGYILAVGKDEWLEDFALERGCDPVSVATTQSES